MATTPLRTAALAPLLVALACATGCATVLQGNHEVVTFQSTPPARVVADGQVVCKTTPCAVNLDTTAPWNVRIEAEGHKPYTLTLVPEMEWGWIAMDFMLYMIPLLVDATTGAWYGLDPEELRVVLVPEGSAEESYNTPPPTSADLRQEREGELLAGFGPAVAVGFNANIAVGFHLDPDTLLSLSGEGQVSIFAPENFSERLYAAAGLGIKRFLGNSAYILVGAGVLKNQTSLFLGAGDIDTARATFTDYGLQLALGNQWEFEGFHVGIEWLGAWITMRRTDIQILDADTNLPTSSAERASEGTRILQDDSFPALRYTRLTIGSSF